MTMLSIVVPFLNEIDQMADLVAHLREWQEKGCEVLLVDGGSEDGSEKVAEAGGLKVVRSQRGRAAQMNAGARVARGDVIIFLHADTRLPSGSDTEILQVMSASRRVWGRFDVRITGRAFLLHLIAPLMNLRSRLTGIATGDQCIFVRSASFHLIDGFPDQPLMEDIEISRRLKSLSRPICLNLKATTSGRRWESHGVFNTTWLMWRLRWAYWRGASPESLKNRYP